MTAATASTLPIRFAAAIYSVPLRLSWQPSIVERRGELLQSFCDACSDEAVESGAMGVFARTLSEIWDLVRANFSPRRRAALVSEPSSSAQPPKRASRGLAFDLRHAMRALWARKADTSLVVGLLAVGLATTSSIFAVADALIINPAPFPHSKELVQVWSTNGQSSFLSMPRDLAVRWLERSDLFASGGGYTQTSALVTSGGDAEVIPAIEVSPGLFETLGVRPMLGRNFVDEDRYEGSNRVAVIANQVWVSRFGKAPDVIGKTLRINAIDYRVIGVMAPEFRFPNSTQRIWMPLALRNPPASRQNFFVTMVARMHPGMTRDQLKQQVEAAGPAMSKLALRPWKMSATTRFFDEVLMPKETKRSIWLLLGATVLLMLTVCANVANLGLSQAFSRARDAAIRSALGASRWRLVRETLVEQLLIGAIALACALPLTLGGIRLAEALLPTAYTLSSLNPLDIDLRLFCVMATLAFSAPVLSGLVPAIAGSRPSVVSALKQEGRSVTGSRASRWFRKGLVVVEVACSVVLLVSAALLVRSFIRLQHVEKGFDSKNLISASVGFPSNAFGDDTSRALYLDAAVQRLRQVPGVKAATFASGVPPENGGITFGSMNAETAPDKSLELILSMYEVRPEFFDTIGVKVREGRSLEIGEATDHIVVSETFAAKFWPGQTAAGKRVRWEKDGWKEIVGVVATVKEGNGTNEAFPQIYTAIQPPKGRTVKDSDAIPEWKKFAVRVDDAALAIPAIRAALKEVNSGIVVSNIERVDDKFAKDLDRPRFLLALMVVFAVAGLVLASIGVYGVLSCLVAEQLREYGIRLMLGAAPSAISRAILTGGLGTVSVGLVVGIAAAAALGKTINAVLFEVQSHDVLSYVLVAAVLIVAAAAAAWRPAHRARTVDPAVLLRNN